MLKYSFIKGFLDILEIFFIHIKVLRFCDFYNIPKFWDVTCVASTIVLLSEYDIWLVLICLSYIRREYKRDYRRSVGS